MTTIDQRDYSEEQCQISQVHETIVEEVQRKMPDDDTLCDVAELFKVFGDMTRTKILSALLEAELCVCDISEIVKMSTSAVSHQLRILRQTKIVKSRRAGKEIYYSLDDSHISQIYQMALEHLKEERND